MNTNTPANNVPSQGILQKLSKKLPSGTVALLAGWGLIAAPDNNAVAQTLPSDAPTITQTGSFEEVRQVEKDVAKILEQPPVDTLRVRAIQIFADAEKRKSFRSAAEQEEFFHILTALQQNKKTKEEAMFTVYKSGGDYLKLFNDNFFKVTLKTNRYVLAKLMVT